MWDWISCNLLGRHEETVSCDHASVHLRCLKCGRRSDGWHLTDPALVMKPVRQWPHAALTAAPRQHS
jgi:hypothetical protein